MTSIFEPLFDTYGDSVMRKHGVFDETELMKALDGLSLEQPAKNEVCDLLFNCYLRWSTAAFAVGAHLGLSLGAQTSGHADRRPPSATSRPD